MELYNKVKAAGCATVTKAERKEKTEETPLLYDPTTLQKEANAKHGFTAEQTFEIAQKLYEKEVDNLSENGKPLHPRRRVCRNSPNCSLSSAHSPNGKTRCGQSRPTRRQRGRRQVTDHHALLVTGEKPLFLQRGQYHLSDDCRAHGRGIL